MTNAIEIENVSKLYRLGTVGTGTFSHDLNRWWYRIRGKEDPYQKIGGLNDRSQKTSSKDENEYIWALQDINFSVAKGQILGIIGTNGAGKSTLLKLLSRVTAPTTGCIRARGHVASLLEVGTGFHPELTGRENIFLNGAILGMRRAEIQRRLDEIVDFSGCGKYLDTPVKRYSSGMMVRLGFAVAAHLDCEVLIVDEVLAVGDASFQSKCIGKMKDIATDVGKTILFVSHNMGSVHQLCSHGLLLNQGTCGQIGPVREVIDQYLANDQPKSASQTYLNTDGKEFHIDSVSCAQDGAIRTACSNDREISIRTNIVIKKSIPGCYVTTSVLDKYGAHILFSDIRDSIPNAATTLESLGSYAFEVIIPRALLNAGEYSINVGIACTGEGVLDIRRDALRFTIEDVNSSRKNRLGVIGTTLAWEMNSNRSK